MTEKGTVTPPVPDTLASGGSSLPFQQHSETAASADLQDAAVSPDEHVEKSPLEDDTICVARGMRIDLHNVFKKDYVSINPHLVGQDDVLPKPVDSETPGPPTEALPGLGISRSPDNATAFDMKIEHFGMTKTRLGATFWILFHFRQETFDSTPRRDTFIPISVRLGSALELPEGNIAGTGVLPTPDAAMSNGPFRSDTETLLTLIEENQGEESTWLLDIPEMTAAEAGLRLLFCVFFKIF
ncbi:hypothetical protein NL676_003706 [Syzygium grande]|nr:hypothetical protein NL676_003706 [Syzygium grande]